MSLDPPSDKALTRAQYDEREREQGPQCATEHCLRPPYEGGLCKACTDRRWWQAKTHAEHGRSD